ILNDITIKLVNAILYNRRKWYVTCVHSALTDPLDRRSSISICDTCVHITGVTCGHWPQCGPQGGPNSSLLSCARIHQASDHYASDGLMNINYSFNRTDRVELSASHLATWPQQQPARYYRC